MKVKSSNTTQGGLLLMTVSFPFLREVSKTVKSIKLVLVINVKFVPVVDRWQWLQAAGLFQKKNTANYWSEDWLYLYNSCFQILQNIMVILHLFQTKDNPSTVDFVTKINHLKSHDGFSRVLFSSYCKKVGKLFQ